MKYLATLSLIFMLSLTASGQRGIEKHFYPPELVIELGDKIDLSKDQGQAIRTLYKEAQFQFLELHWDLDAKYAALEELVAQPKVELAEARELMLVVLELESKVKLLHLKLQLEVKNILSQAQQQKIDHLRGEH